MFKHFILIAMMAIAAAACEKSANLSVEEARLQGVWTLRQVGGGIHGQGYQADFSLLELDRGRYRLLTSTQVLVSEGQYQFDPGDSLELQFLPADPSSTSQAFEQDEKSVSFSGTDTLLLNDPCCDRWEYRFERSED
jgi:hypothetical protein